MQVKPDFWQARCNRSLILLGEGELAAAWPDYEYRWTFAEAPRRTFAQPQWAGQPLGDRVLLVHAEQGLGDTLQFIRYLPRIAAPPGQLVCEVQPALLPLLSHSGFDRLTQLVPRGRPLPGFDFHVPLLSLPGVFGTTLETIPAEVPYLAADPQRVDYWRQRLGPAAGLRVGIAWQGSTTYQADRFRSIPLAQFAPLAQREIELISLQMGAGSEQLAGQTDRFSVRDLGPELDRDHGAFVDSAAVIANLDLVITSDTAIAHLAGGLGAEVWVALPLCPDWRWLRDREDSPWYPTMRLFRQRRFDDWSEVFARVAAALAHRAGRGSA